VRRKVSWVFSIDIVNARRRRRSIDITKAIFVEDFIIEPIA